MKSLQVVVGGQFGSESKGRVTLERIHQANSWALQSPRRSNVWSVRVGGPNAGHVVHDHNGVRFALRQLPVGAVLPTVQLAIAAGSEVDLQVLRDEVNLLESHGHAVRHRLWIHPEATYLEPRHLWEEQRSDLNARLGSTAKGIGAARADRVWRKAQRVVDADYTEVQGGVFSSLGKVEAWDELARIRGVDHVVIEGTQGYGLGLHAGHYPQCTSGDARAIDFCAQAGLNPWEADTFQVHLVVRPNPIRVAGNSGELPGETTWTDLDLPEERTTVTQKVRRVGAFDPGLVEQAVLANGPSKVQIHLAFADYVAPGLAGATRLSQLQQLHGAQFLALQEWVSAVPFNQQVVALGTGPDTSIQFNHRDQRDAFQVLLGFEENQ